ncbi:pyridoxal phosphate-dependent aminotransferase [Aerobium aerolatum]|uniref:Aminotransferase n=1 Tax=Aquamicrobium aerolatum DSM 21857 TaxID=1121003 RepID=A0A1I3HCS8_9HYPH|nr:pyridoxal phosphate-dependent aminotransferase [Aquamicrobium aerolatum]SFI33439.1 Aspartate/methionine/tyrosine aminotransferase [Aquamicrobium aerolatum DSM 21857]
MSQVEFLRDVARGAPESGIVELVNHARGRADLIPLWVGEGDLPTPDFITRAASEALAAGETFYTWQRGIPELREALARYYARQFGGAFKAEEFIVSTSGMHAIQMAIDAVAGHGDEIVYLSPAWPNFAASAELAGVKPVPVTLERSGNGWTCDVEKIRAAVSGSTKAIFINSPSNPTGWTADRATLKSILDVAREKGVWLIADEIYSRFYYGGARAPSFIDVMEPDDRIIFVNSFSKNWSMTGWRIGWLRTHPSLQQVFENLVQYSVSGVPAFLQRGAVAALDHGDAFVDEQVQRARAARDIVCDRLLATGRVKLAAPEGAFYAFFSIDGVADTRQAALDLVDSCGVGLAPGSAFGAGGDGSFRLCFHRRLDHVEEAAGRIADWIRKI